MREGSGSKPAGESLGILGQGSVHEFAAPQSEQAVFSNSGMQALHKMEKMRPSAERLGVCTSLKFGVRVRTQYACLGITGAVLLVVIIAINMVVLRARLQDAIGGIAQQQVRVGWAVGRAATMRMMTVW